MSSTSDADILVIDPNQTGKAFAINTAFAAIDQMLGDTLAISPQDGLHASPYVIPYATADEPAGTKTAIRFILLQINGTLAADWTAYMPTAKKKLFLVQNNTVGGHNVIVKVSGQTGVTVAPATVALCYLNGTDVAQMPVAAAPGSQPWDIANFVNGQPTTGQVVMRWIPSRTITFAANFANNQMKAGTAAAGAAVFTVNKNGVQVGTASFIGGGSTPAWASSGGTPVIFNAGDVGTFIAPNPQDAGLADIEWTFSGTR